MTLIWTISTPMAMQGSPVWVKQRRTVTAAAQQVNLQQRKC